jgi:hypothetical protein
VSPAVLLLALGVVAAIAAGVMLVNSRSSRARLDVEAGLEALRTLRWKDFAQHVVHAFETRGYQPQAGQRKPGEDGVDYLLTRGRDKHLLQIKHGGAYAVGTAAVRRLLSMLDAQGATGGILVTSGHFETQARQAAKGQALVLVDGEALWAQLLPVLPAALVDNAQGVAAERDRRRRTKLQLALVASIVVAVGGAAIYGRERLDRVAPPAVTAVAPTPTASAAAPPAAAAPVPAQGDPTAAEAPPTAAPTPSPAATPARTAPATEEELAAYREIAAASALLVDGVMSATWPTRSTLLIAVKAGGDEAKRLAIVQEVCAGLLRREELRFTRLQMHDYDTDGSEPGPVRWRQCQ